MLWKKFITEHKNIAATAKETLKRVLFLCFPNQFLETQKADYLRFFG